MVHAHLHLIPGGEELRDRLLREAVWRKINGLRDLSGLPSHGYAYLGFGEDAWWIDNPGFPGQWVRRVIARWAGVPNQWDWALFRGTQQLNQTLKIMGVNGY